MHRAQRISQQNDIARIPSAGFEQWKLTPDRLIRHQWLAIQIRREYALTIHSALFIGHTVETGAPPGIGIAFDDKSAHRRTVAIVVRDERAVRISAEGQTQAFE